MKKLKILSSISLICFLTACNTTQSVSKTDTVKIVETPKEKVEKTIPEVDTQYKNPFENKDILANQVVTSSKPIICGRIDTVLERMKSTFGEVPILLGKVAVQLPGKEGEVLSALTYNFETGTYTFLEQMPFESRLICILSSGTGRLENILKETVL